MKADVQYNDLIGTVAADIADFSSPDCDLSGLAKNYKIDTERYNPVGMSLYGPSNFNLSFLCIDKEKSTESKAHIVRINVYDIDEVDLEVLFKRLHIVLYNKFEEKYQDQDYDETITIEIKEDENKEEK